MKGWQWSSHHLSFAISRIGCIDDARRSVIIEYVTIYTVFVRLG